MRLNLAFAVTVLLGSFLAASGPANAAPPGGVIAGSKAANGNTIVEKVHRRYAGGYYYRPYYSRPYYPYYSSGYYGYTAPYYGAYAYPYYPAYNYSYSSGYYPAYGYSNYGQPGVHIYIGR